MKIYYYILNSSLWIPVPVFKFEEIEVEEKPKTFIFGDKRPSNYYNSRLSKDDAGFVRKGYRELYLFLLERNDDLAKKKFVEYLNSQIEGLGNQIKNIEEKKRIVMDFKGET